MNPQEPVMLTEDLFISKGHHRACYHYPEHPDKCIKVILSEDGKRICAFEFKYIKILYGRGFDPKTIPHYYGTVPTNLGVDHLGYVYDIVENADGTDALCLHDFFVDEALFRAHEAELLTLMEKLRQDLYNNQVIVRSLEAWNVLFPRAEDGSFSIRLVNDLGMPNKIKLPYHSGFLAHRHVEQHWRKFKHDMRPYYKGNEAAQRFIDKV